jgi:hypothetical protein
VGEPVSEPEWSLWVEPIRLSLQVEPVGGSNLMDFSVCCCCFFAPAALLHFTVDNLDVEFEEATGYGHNYMLITMGTLGTTRRWWGYLR